MKTLITATIVALGVAAPTFAQSQLELSVGADAGQYTIGELVQLKAASTLDADNEGRVFLGNQKINFSASNIHNSVAASVIDRIAAESAENE